MPHVINEIKRLVDSDRQSEIRLNANGGNSILVMCDPMKELAYIAEFRELLPSGSYEIIDLNQCLIDFVSSHKDQLETDYDSLQSATHEIYKAPANEESGDLFKEILAKVQIALLASKVPVLINTGALYGTGIHNVNIMEHDIVMKATMPLIILYPATIEPDRIMFLGKQSASKYRCMIIQ